MEYIVVGHIQNTHGIKGELKIKPLTDYIERFEEDVNYFLGDKKVKAKIESFRFYRGLVYLKFTDFDNINQVLPFKGQYLYVEKSDRFEIDDGRY
ncbi:MAG: ribosome maturation factor RimM, partial [Peptoniphilaceae bacterium]|nr:ribosome maturation factor RimM [Peptoniphilaceae bacterium]